MTTKIFFSELQKNPTCVSAFLVVLLSFLDGAATVFEVQAGLAIEVNPLMAALIEFNSATFLSVKLLITILGIGFLLSVSNYRLARVGIHSLALVYILVVLYHMFGLFL